MKFIISLLILFSFVFLNFLNVESKLNFQNRQQTDKKPNAQPKIHTPEYYDTSFLKSPSEIKESPNDFLVQNLPGLLTPLESYAGLINVNNTSGGNLFFWFFPANTTNHPANTTLPVNVWINGGPGCSSMDSVFIETGPLRFDGNADNTSTFYINPWSWHNSAHMLYIDQPFGTGLSYVTDDNGLVTNDLEINQAFYQFLQSFFTIFTDYQKNPFFISGESYAGHYIPHIASFILNMNNNSGKSSSIIPINIQGIAMGNGYTHPTVQVNAYRDFAYYGIGIIGIEQYNAYGELNNLCQEQLSLGNYNSEECANVFNTLMDDSGSNSTTQVNMYDYRLYDPTGGNNWPLPGIDQEAVYLNRPDVRAAIHATATPHPWAECNDTVNALLTNQDESSLFLFPELLSNMRVLVYNGQFDIICNHLGTTQYLDSLQWNGSVEWSKAPHFTWTSVDERGELTSGGYGKTTQNLTFILAVGGSHMYPMNMPSTSFDMITRFMQNKSFDDLPQSVGVPTPTPETLKKPVPLTLPAWIGITVGGFVGGLLIGGIVIFLFMRKNKHGYHVIQ